jgi:hypothetical protein
MRVQPKCFSEAAVVVLFGLTFAGGIMAEGGAVDSLHSKLKTDAKIAKQKVNQRIETGGQAGGEDGEGGGSSSSANCGSVDIGNVDTDGRLGGAPREVTVIITGDVINANNNCR